MDAAQIFSTVLLIVEYIVKVVAIGWVPENRRPSSSSAWLLLILFLPAVGLPLFWLIGSPYVRGRREGIQRDANRLLADGLRHLPSLPPEVQASPHLSTVVSMNRQLTSLPLLTGRNDGLLGEEHSSLAEMAEAVRRSQHYVHVEVYIMAWDPTTDDFFTALAEAAGRGVHVRLLMDHLGSRKYPGWRQFRQRLTAAGIDWHLMMPIDLLRRRWRRPDLRNHRKLLVIDGTTAFMGSQNIIDSAYGSVRNAQIGRRWKDLNIRLSGAIVASLEAVFAVDWYTETGEVLDPADHLEPQVAQPPGGPINAFQLVPSGPGFSTEPNLRLFTSLIGSANHHLSITSPYFVPDEGLLQAITTASFRGVTVDLFVGEKADQFMVHHAQRSYYSALLEAGVRIHLYPEPKVLHAKYFVVDDTVAVIGSSNMDFRSFHLDYEISLMGFGGDLVEQLRANDQEYLAISKTLTLEQWKQQPWPQRYLDNVMRLTSALQ